MARLLCAPVFVWPCLQCGKELRDCFEQDEDGVIENDDWSHVTQERAFEVIQRRGWFLSELGYVFCSEACHSINLIEHEDSFRRMRYNLTEALGADCPDALRFGVKQ